MTIPTDLDGSNTVSGNAATSINMVNDKAYYAPVTFTAASATFTYTFPTTENGTGWHSFVLPFKPASIIIDGVPATLDDAFNHFWIYEFADEDNNGELVFAPVTELCGRTPYIIAADSHMAGRSIVFSASNVPFYKTESDKMIVSSQHYKFLGTTLAPSVKDCYVLNAAGTAYEYVTANTTVSGLNAYFTTKLSEGQRPSSVALPEVPLRTMVLNEESANSIASGAYATVTLKHTFAAGWNTLCVPFAIDDIEAVLGNEAKAWQFTSYSDGALGFSIASSLSAGVPYVVYVPAAITEDIILTDIDINATASTDVYRNGACFRGTYAPVAPGEWIKSSSTDLIYGLTTDGRIRKAGSGASIKGFRAYFDLPAGAQVKELIFEDDATGIASHLGKTKEGAPVYNLAGQRLNKMQKGVNIINGKKILK